MIHPSTVGDFMNELRFLAAIAAVGTLLCASAAAAETARKDVLKTAARVADWQLGRMDGAHITSHMAGEARDPRSWQQGAFWVGMMKLADVSKDPRFTKAILDMGKSNQWTPGPRVTHADDHVIAQPYLWAATHGAGPESIAKIRATFDEILREPPVVHLSFYFNKNYGEAQCLTRWCWCDAIFMSPPAWLDLAGQTGDRKYRDYAMTEFWAATDFLYDPAEKLYFRDSRFFERRDDKGRKLFWSRGNGWVFAGIANMLDELPANDPDRARLENLFRDMAVKIAAIQKPDGYWAPSLLGAENSPPETSGTGFYVYGLAWGVERGLLDAATYRPAIDRGWTALTRAVAKDGRLGWVQQVSDRPETVNEADTQYYGVGAFLLAASAVAELADE
jgi:rhamnogalacturonyl hydrolase YesR